MPKLEVFPIALAGGLQDSRPIPEPGDMQTLSNVALFRGRFALRAPVTVTARLMSHASDETPTPVDQVLTTRHHKGKLYALAWRGGAINKTYLYRLEANGTPEGGGTDATPVTATAVWTGATLAKPVMVSFDGGSAIAPVSRLYMADWSVNYDTRFWDSDGSTLNNVTEDFDDSGVKENLRFALIWTYQFHMWGTGFFAAGASQRPEFVRFSQAGLIPSDEPNVTNNIAREWWFVDGFGVGRRGDRPVAVGFAGGGTVILKRHESYVLFGYDADSWAVRQLSGKVGVVGPNAAASTGDGLCAFWSDKGPQITDGQTVVDIAEDIRKHVNEVGFDEAISAEYSPDDGIMYFTIPSLNKYLAYDLARKKWAEGQWLNSGGTALKVNQIYAAPQDTLPGPVGAPSGLTTVSELATDTELVLNWVNGDTALDTTTLIHRGTITGFTVNDASQIASVVSGVAAYTDTGRTPKTHYFYRVRHRRNSQNSANSNENEGLTRMTEPTNLIASGLINGIRITFTNNEAGADIKIERKPSGGAWSIIDALIAQSSGAKTYDDTTTDCGSTYSYRVYNTSAGDLDSGVSNEGEAVACFSPPTLTAADHNASIGEECPMGNNVVVNWSGTNIDAADVAKVYRNVDGAGYVLRATLPLQNLAYSEQWAKKDGGSSSTLRYKVEAYDDGGSLSSTIETTQSAHNISSELCSES